MPALTNDVLARNITHGTFRLENFSITSISATDVCPDVTVIHLVGIYSESSKKELEFILFLFPNVSNLLLTESFLVDDDISCLAGLKGLLVLNLSHNKLKTFPTTLLSLHLRALILTDNSIDLIPDLCSILTERHGPLHLVEEMSDAVHYDDTGKVKHQSRQKREMLPNEVHLNTLVMSENPLSSQAIREDFLYFPNLRKISLTACALTKFPVVQSSGLRELKLAKNRIASIPAEFHKISSLNLLDIANNKLLLLKDVRALENATRLRQLIISGNECLNNVEVIKFLETTFTRLNNRLRVNNRILEDFIRESKQFVARKDSQKHPSLQTKNPSIPVSYIATNAHSSLGMLQEAAIGIQLGPSSEPGKDHVVLSQGVHGSASARKRLTMAYFAEPASDDGALGNNTAQAKLKK